MEACTSSTDGQGHQKKHMQPRWSKWSFVFHTPLRCSIICAHRILNFTFYVLSVLKLNAMSTLMHNWMHTFCKCFARCTRAFWIKSCNISHLAANLCCHVVIFMLKLAQIQRSKRRHDVTQVRDWNKKTGHCNPRPSGHLPCNWTLGLASSKQIWPWRMVCFASSQPCFVTHDTAGTDRALHVLDVFQRSFVHSKHIDVAETYETTIRHYKAILRVVNIYYPSQPWLWGDSQLPMEVRPMGPKHQTLVKVVCKFAEQTLSSDSSNWT